MELDDAYANAAYIPGGNDYPDKWAQAAAAFREIATCEIDLPYGETSRQRCDLFHPARLPKGLIVFVHGGYWLRFDKNFWSHLAAGPLAHGWSVAMPSYDLCPDVRISEIGDQINRAIAFAAARIPGPIRLIGHSAGGQLVARVTAPRLGARWQERLEKVVSVSPVADLAPLMRTSMNADLKIDEEEAAAESPIHLPAPPYAKTVWVGADERPAFLEQAQALTDAWDAKQVITEREHHFSVIEPLEYADSPLTREIAADDAVGAA
ncbi:alpha/beta hydrolase [Yoonia litorea]|uniref:Acetyl esterase/lipase n=1 Tax=Yoonia litorea TaxID=1123755 RepID=A0A1I6LB22_9RHOB|nr:alpha/beta hydrolase [Yoonia litorea]SFS00671.1 Acetyl esterase/lipase [Yoonia litorea]